MKANEELDANLWQHPMVTEEMRAEMRHWILMHFFRGIDQMRTVNIRFDMSGTNAHCYMINDEGRRYVDPNNTSQAAMEWIFTETLPPVDLWDKFMAIRERFGE